MLFLFYLLFFLFCLEAHFGDEVFVLLVVGVVVVVGMVGVVTGVGLEAVRGGAVVVVVTVRHRETNERLNRG